MKHWLIKTEPSSWSWQDQIQHETTLWDGVRNYQAANNMQAMQTGDLCFFYHSVSERKIFGIVEVISLYQPDPSDETGRFGMVGIKVVKGLPKPVSLDAIRTEPRLAHLPLVRQSRLSVMPVDNLSWNLILKMGDVI